MWLFTKNEGIFKAYSFFFILTDFPCFQGPVGAMYQSEGKCFRIHFREASIHKMSGGCLGSLTPHRFLGARLAPQTDTLTLQAG